MDDDTDDGWDLQAVVRGCTAPAAPTNPRLSLADQINSFDFLNYQNINNNHVGNNNNDTFQDLQDAYLEFCSDPPSAVDIPGATSAVSFPGDHNVFQPAQDIIQILRMNNVPSQENMQFNNNNPSRIGSSSSWASSQNLQAANPQPIRQRRRKNQQMKIVRQMTQEELSADSWAWRKYGQKPIKGSPYPRNYYRCNTSKGCAARKQVERSSIVDPGLFLVSYSGEHTHSRPTHHRSSLPGSNLSKSSTAAGTNNSNNNNNKLLSRLSSSARLSPGTLLEVSGNGEVDMTGEEEEEDENIFMISNQDDGDDDMFKRFHDSHDHDHSSGGGDFYSVPTVNAHRVRG